MNIVPFEEIKLKIQELKNPKIYADDSAVEGLFSRTEVLLTRIEEPEAKQTFKRIFNEVKHRTRVQNNNQKLIALDTLIDTIIGTANTLRQDFIESSYKASQSKAKLKLMPVLILIGKWVGGVITALFIAYLIARLGWN